MTTQSHPERIQKQVDVLLAQMTLEEKIAQLGSYWIYDLQTGGVLDDQKMSDKLPNGIGQITRNAGAGNLRPLEAAQSYNRIQKFLKEQTRLGIPAINHEECCAGVMSPGCSSFPQMIGLASTFQPELAARMTDAIRKQMLAMGARQGLAPVLDVARDPRWGRLEETFGEDPTLVSQFGTAYIRGLQGGDLHQGVIATGKHFIGHSFSQGGLNCGPVHLGRQDLWDVYLAPFQAAIRDARLASMMNAYPELDGEVVAASRRIITGLLRETLHFDGLVVSDYEAVMMIHSYHNAAEDRKSAAVKALTAGIDVELPAVMCYGPDLISALKSGEISMEVVDQSVRRHLQKKYELGLFENPFVDEGTVLQQFDSPENLKLAYEIACKSIILLKNDGLLPLNKDAAKIAVIGPNADSGRNMMGDYSYPSAAEFLAFQAPEGSAYRELSKTDLESLTSGITTILNAVQAKVTNPAAVTFAKGCEIASDDRSGFDEAVQTASEADVVILVLGDKSGLAPDCTTGEFRDAASLALPGVQEDLARAVLETGTPAVIVLVNGRPAAIPGLVEKSDAVLEAWLPGPEGGRAVAAVLFGDVNPGGKLPVTIPRGVGQVPVFYNYKPSGMRSNIYGDYVSEKTAPLFPFGHGLSYTTFTYSDLVISQKTALPGETVDIALKVTNTGRRAGEEVIQLYIRDVFASLPRPVKELKGFTRISLQPGESRTATFHLPVNQLAYYDLDLNLVIEPGKFLVMAGSSSEDIRLTGEFDISGEDSARIADRVLVCPVEIR